MTNRIPFSVRLDADDAEFIASLDMAGINTPSDKIRELLRLARVSVETENDYQSRLTQSDKMVQNARHQILTAEKALGIHSPIVARVLELMPDLMATVCSDSPTGEPSKKALIAYEQQIMWRVVRLMNGILQLGITGKAAGYDDGILDELTNTIALAVLIKEQQKNTINQEQL